MFDTKPRIVLPPITNLPLSESDIRFFNVYPEPSAPQYQEMQPMKMSKVGKGLWTQQEDKMLLDAMATFTGHICWEELSKMIPGRTAKQCRERWQFRLHPDVNKAPFEPWEDDLIIRERVNCGNHWAQIAQMLPGRTSCAVKNRWYTVLRNRKEEKPTRRAKVIPGPSNPFYYETLLLRDKKELWTKGSNKK